MGMREEKMDLENLNKEQKKAVIVKKIMKDLNYDIKQFSPKAVKNKISSCKNELMTPNDYEKYVAGDFDQIILDVYRKY